MMPDGEYEKLKANLMEMVRYCRFLENDDEVSPLDYALNVKKKFLELFGEIDAE